MSFDDDNNTAETLGMCTSVIAVAGISKKVSGSSGPEIASMLARIGRVFGGGMGVGVIVCATAPVIIGYASYSAYKYYKKQST